ncbi:MAG TPA: carboxypeptidase-like regulatory domain-containing protein [Longimicrobiaceae bacterium]
MRVRFPLLVALLVLPRILSAQLGGRVVDPGGRALPGATVEVWGARERLASARTDSTGAFAFSASQTADAVGLLTRRIGFAPLRRSVLPPASGLVLQLSPAPVALEGLVVSTHARPACPRRDTPEARALWEAASRRYSRTPDTLGIATSAEVFRGEVPRTGIGQVDEARLVPATFGTGNVRRQVHRSRGYGVRNPLRTMSDELHASWYYLPLGSHAAGHFVDPSFGEHNALAVHARTPDRVVLAFCSRGLAREAVGVEGTLTLAADTTLSEAAWRYRTPSPREDAGGEVVFAPYARGAPEPWLVPASSLYWRGIIGRPGRYIQQWVRFGAWSVAPPDSELHNERAVRP